MWRMIERELEREVQTLPTFTPARSHPANRCVKWGTGRVYVWNLLSSDSAAGKGVSDTVRRECFLYSMLTPHSWELSGLLLCGTLGRLFSFEEKIQPTNSPVLQRPHFDNPDPLKEAALKRDRAYASGTFTFILYATVVCLGQLSSTTFTQKNQFQSTSNV